MGTISSANALRTVKSMYKKLFGTEGESSGINYWVSQIRSGKIKTTEELERYMTQAAKEIERKIQAGTYTPPQGVSLDEVKRRLQYFHTRNTNVGNPQLQTQPYFGYLPYNTSLYRSTTPQFQLGEDFVRKDLSKRESASFNWSGSFSGLPPQLQEVYIPFLKSVLSESTGLGSLIRNILSGKINEGILTSFLDANKLLVKNFENSLRPIMEEKTRKGIENLAVKGVIDSSVAERVLSEIASTYLSKLADFQRQLEYEALKRAYEYPFTAARVLGNIIPTLLGTTRTSQALSVGLGSSIGSSVGYDPTPALSFFRALIGL